LPLPLSGELSSVHAEVSGMAWYGEFLILLPQYPARFASSGEAGWEGAVFALAKNQIQVYLDGEVADPLNPIPIRFDDGGVAAQVRGFEGFEAIGFAGDRIFLTIESHAGRPMLSYLVSGNIQPDLSKIQLDPGSLTPLPPPLNLLNRGDEALSVAGDAVLTFFEVNTADLVTEAVAHQYDLRNGKLDRLPMENVPYRIADATPADEIGRLWAINSYSPAESLLQALMEWLNLPRVLIHASGSPQIIERLIELKYDGSSVVMSGAPPVDLQLAADEGRRNWEALARLEGRGFLLMTDRIPETILAFVPFP
jgi:hypothetical protein